MLRFQGIIAIVGLIALFMILHLGFAPEQHDTRTTMTTLLGGVAFLLMTTSVVLTTRLDVLETLFGGLDRMYQVHRIAGTSVAIFALVHLIGVPKELPEGVNAIANPLMPSAPLGIASLAFLVIGLFIALNRKISYSRWRTPHKLMALVYLVVIGHFMTAPEVFFEQLSPSGILLIAAANVGTLALFYTMLGMNKRTALPYAIEAVNKMERATEIVLRPRNKTIDFKPGQFAFVEIQGKGWAEPHPFTISSAPGEKRLRFTMKVLGDWTRKVREELPPGRDVLVRGPYGRFDTLSSNNRKQVWIAGGIGLTPFLSMLRDMETGDQRQIEFVYAARNRKDALFLEELLSYADDLDNLSLHPIFSDDGDFARIDIAKEKLSEPLSNYDFFLCGAKPMIDALIIELKKEGVSRAQIHTEAFEFR